MRRRDLPWCAALLLGPVARAQSPAANAWTRLTPHPRLLADEARVRGVWAQRDAVSQQLQALVQHQADTALTAAPLDYVDRGSFLVGDMRQVQGRVIALAFMYRATGQARYLDAARRELLALAALPTWGPNHFLGVGEAALTAAIGLDWLHPHLALDERALITQAIADKALRPSLQAREGTWLNAEYNWNPVCHAGLVAGALVIAETEPDLAREVVARAVRYLPVATAAYEPDGVYPEGPSYWSYGTSFHIILTECLRSALGSAFGLDQGAGFLRSADAIAQIVGPSGEDFNFSDYHRRDNSEPALLWFARQRGRRSVAAPELRNLATHHAALRQAQARGATASLPLSRHLALGLLWWNPALPADNTRLPLQWVAGGKVPVAVMRSAWGDPRALFLAIKGGTPDNSHGHMDIGSFVFEADGVRWAVDLPAESYPKMRAAKLDLWNYSQDSSRWTTFRIGPEGHNILRFDGQRQQVVGRSTISDASAPGVPGALVDLTPSYEGQVARVQRRASLLPGRALLLQDDWLARDKPVDVTWQWLTYAAVTVTGQRLLLRQAGQRLVLEVTASVPFAVELQDVSQARAPQDSDNPGLKRIVLRLATPAGAAGQLRVQAQAGRR
jgi:oligo-alginate lyase